MKNENTSKEYVCVRVQIVRVRKRLFGLKDEVLGFTTVIPNTPKQAERIFKEIQKGFRKYGVEMKIE
ncbi:unnamed protein product [marine sediment metagenome]|uniref:Uncharacterized protein n=1 Tax=marine sediment metagenome TaxID=412755 RepID=X1GL97_9ZZZZ